MDQQPNKKQEWPRVTLIPACLKQNQASPKFTVILGYMREALSKPTNTTQSELHEIKPNHSNQNPQSPSKELSAYADQQLSSKTASCTDDFL